MVKFLKVRERRRYRNETMRVDASRVVDAASASVANADEDRD